MRSMLIALIVVLGLLAGHFASVINSQQTKLNMAVHTIATEIAHTSIDTDERLVAGNISVESIGGTRYRARGTTISSRTNSVWIAHWTFTLDLDLPFLTTDLTVEPNGTEVFRL